jgi:hypothetical protein
VTSDEVVARAKELEGQEVLLTVRGVVTIRQTGTMVVRLFEADAWDVPIVFGAGEVVPDLEDIRPAPMRIAKGQRYADASGRLFEGDSDGGLWELAAGYILAGEVHELDGLRPVKVVDA